MLFAGRVFISTAVGKRASSFSGQSLQCGFNKCYQPAPLTRIVRFLCAVEGKHASRYIAIYILYTKKKSIEEKNPTAIIA